MKTLSTIKNTALHGKEGAKKARTVIQRHDLACYGFDCGAQITIEYQSDSIVRRALVDGPNKVSRVVDKRRGVVYQVIDIKWPLSDRLAMFGNAERLTVRASNGLILIEAETKGILL